MGFGVGRTEVGVEIPAVEHLLKTFSKFIEVNKIFHFFYKFIGAVLPRRVDGPRYSLHVYTLHVTLYTFWRKTAIIIKI